jgi:type VI secretion system protein ImpC
VAALKAAAERLEQEISDQLNEIIHSPEYRQIEQAWRGLHHLVYKSGIKQNFLEVRVLPVSKSELFESTLDYPGGDYVNSPLYTKLYIEGLGTMNGKPQGAIVGDYEFNHEAVDVGIMRRMSQIAADCQCPFISSAHPSLFKLKSWRDLGEMLPVDEILDLKDRADFRSLRDDPNSRYLGLTAIRTLGRPKFGKDKPVHGLNFEEDLNGDPENCVWVNPAFLMATNIANAFENYGWCAQIRGRQSGGLVKDLPTVEFERASGVNDHMGPAEYQSNDPLDFALSNAGVIGVYQVAHTKDVAFISGQSVNRPVKYAGSKGIEATESHELSARLPYTFAACRIMHYLKAMVRDWVGGTLEQDEIQFRLNDWLNRYVLPNPQGQSQETLAQRPLRWAKVEVKPIEGRPGYYVISLRIRPHFQLEGASVDVAMVGQAKQGG